MFILHEIWDEVVLKRYKKGDFSRMKPTKVEIDVTDNKIYVVKNGLHSLDSKTFHWYLSRHS